MPNRLASETSPYLLQHAENPVDWYPWGPEALERAGREDKPILLSIGYAACHWCHVMAHESFEDAETAALMNAHFVNIKVDREERPDLDSIYMQAVQAMTGHGGWPMTVFLTPDGAPFYGGTYFPTEDRHGMPSFRTVLAAVADSFAKRRNEILQSAGTIRTIYSGAESPARSGGEVTPEQMAQVYSSLTQQYDAQYAGFGGAPKFPPTMALDFLLRHWARTGTKPAIDMAMETFMMMARGGIYDQIGGGFARYSVDEKWLVPHFEKMLYDNALLVRLGSHLYQASHLKPFRAVTEETIGWLTREMISPDGGFYSSLDADSEGHEGKFYVWDARELDDLLGDDAEVVKRYYGVSESGNFEGKNILFVASELSGLSASLGHSESEIKSILDRAKTTLLSARERRVRPSRDDKVIASWNGLMLRGLTEAAAAFAHPEYLVLAERNARFLATHLVRDGRVMRTYTAGQARIPGFLDDHASVALGFLSLFERSLNKEWLQLAQQIEAVIIQYFWNEETGTFFDTASDADALITRPRDITDNAIPAGTSLAVELILRLADYTGDETHRPKAQFMLESLIPLAVQHPMAFGHLLGVAEYVMTTTCHGEYCDMPSPRAIDAARGTLS